MSLADSFKKEHLDLSSRLARKLESKKEIPVPHPETIYRVSRVVKMCPREEVLRYIHSVKKFETIDARLQRIFDFGTAVHEFVQNTWFSDWLIGNWQCVSCGDVWPGKRPQFCCGASEFRYKEIRMLVEDYLISGHTDGVLDIDGKHVLLEIKTCSSKQYEVIVNMRKKPLQAHIDQVQLYMWMLGVDKAVIIYLEKDESLLAEFTIEKDDAVAESFIKRVVQAREGMIKKTVPDRELCESATCSRAKACSTKALCFA